MVQTNPTAHSDHWALPECRRDYPMTPRDFIAAHPKACDGGKAFARTCTTMEELWDRCPVAPWLLWIQQRTRTLDRDAVAAYVSLSSRCTTASKTGISPALYTALAERASKAAGSIVDPSEYAERFNAEYKTAMQEQADLVRSLIPNPFKQTEGMKTQ